MRNVQRVIPPLLIPHRSYDVGANRRGAREHAGARMSAIVVIVVLVLVVMGAAAFIAWPIVRGDRIPDATLTPEQLERQRVEEDLERALAAIKEIAFDHASGHLSDADFTQLDSDERARAVALMRERDLLAAPPSSAQNGPLTPHQTPSH